MELTGPSRQQMVQAIERREELTSEMKEKWFDEYLLSRREANRNIYQDEWEECIAVGDIVLISHPNKPRPHWAMGRVTELLPGNDGIVRCVKVVRADFSVGVYSINLLYPLELSVSPVISRQDVDECNINSSSRPPKRAAALACCDKLKSST